ncbi:hypothetical protein EXW35_05050 [Bacillus mycoides]|nr:hypothetical protein EXW35_05050 [Bacillus mycoides]
MLTVLLFEIKIAFLFQMMPLFIWTYLPLFSPKKFMISLISRVRHYLTITLRSPADNRGFFYLKSFSLLG